MGKLEHIRELLKRFYAGETDSREEKELEAFFLSQEVPPEFRADKELFTSMASLSEPVEPPAGLQDDIIKAIDDEERAETRTRRISIYSLSGLAAGLLIILSVYLGFLRDTGNASGLEQYAVEDPQRAYLETKKAFDLISEKWNSGTRELSNLKEVNRGIETVSTINKISSGSKELNLLGNLRKAEEINIQ